MWITEFCGNASYRREITAEQGRNVGAWSVNHRDSREPAGEDLLEQVLDRDNLNRAYLKVKENRGAPGIDKMTVDDAFGWIKEHKVELLYLIRRGEYRPKPARGKDIPKSDGGGKRQLGIPTVVDRIVQQAITQVLTPIYDPTFSENSYGYRPGRSAHQALRQIRNYANQGYKCAVLLDLSKYFDTINHEMLLNILRQRVKDTRVISLIKKCLKAGIMKDGMFHPTEAGATQGSPLSPLLSNIFLDSFDKLMEQRGVRCARYADDIVLFAKSWRAADRLMRNAADYLESKLKLKVNRDKSRVVSVYSNDFKFLGCTLGKNRNGAFIRAHPKSLRKAKAKFRKLTNKNQGRNVRAAMAKEKQYAVGWLGYYSIANIKSTMKAWDSWRRRRYRAYIWRQWKKPKARYKALRKLNIPKDEAMALSNSRKGCWRIAKTQTLHTAISNKRLETAGFFSLEQGFEDTRLRWMNRRVPNGTPGGVGGRLVAR